MIHIPSTARVLFFQYPTLLSRPLQTILIPWRLLAFPFHVCMLLCVADYREKLVVRSSLSQGYTETEYLDAMSSANFAIAASIASLFIVMIGFLSGRTIQHETLNVLHCVSHSLAGSLLFAVWIYEAHAVRIWHIWYFWGFPPAFLEVLVVCRTIRQGIFVW